MSNRPTTTAQFVALTKQLIEDAESVRSGGAPRVPFLLKIDGALEYRSGEDLEARDAKLALYDLRESLTLGRTASGDRDELAQAASEAYTCCMAAWAAGEPKHKVDAMIEAIDNLGILIDQPGAGAGRKH